MSITRKEKELAAVGISVAAGCKPCTDYHIRAVKKTEATDDEIGQAIGHAMAVRRSAGGIIEAHGLRQLALANGEATGLASGETTRLRELVSVGAAFALNCTSNLEHHLAAAREVGVDEDEIRAVLELAAFIKGKAASHVERMAGIEETPEDAAAQPERAEPVNKMAACC